MDPLERLRKELDQLASTLAMAEEPGLPKLLEVLGKCRVWIKKAGETGGLPPGRRWESQIHVLEEGLRAGRPLDQGMERLLALLLEIQKTFGAPPAGPRDNGALPPSPPKNAHSSGTFQMSDDDLSGFTDFIAEVPEYLQAIEASLLALGRGEEWDVMKAYRPFHTLKGVCGFMNLPAFSRLAHMAETLLEPYKKGKGEPTTAQASLLLKIVDAFQSQLAKIQEGIKNRAFIVEDVGALLEECSGLGAAQPVAGASPSVAPGMESHAAPKRENSIRVGIEKLDVLLEAIGELVICQAQVSEGLAGANIPAPVAAETNRLGKISRQLQDIVLSLRMVPVQPLFHRMNRLAHDLSQKTGKPLRVEIKGGETELDKGVVEELVDPLFHILRNAVDHGLETAEARQRAGKAPEGRLFLEAGHEGGDFVLRIGDDGSGLDVEGISQKGKALGLIPEGQEWERAKVIDLIFAPGFSTARELTEVSGRGVGLDVVRRRLEFLRGAVQVDSRPGEGTVFTLRIPLAIALMDGVLVRVGNDRYVLPTYYIRQFLEYGQTQAHRVGMGPLWVRFRDDNIPLVDLDYWLGSQPDLAGRPILVHLEAAGRQAGLLVDEVLGKRQVVVKHLGETLKEARGIAGGAVLGDGRVGLILDVDAFLRERPSIAVN